MSGRLPKESIQLKEKRFPAQPTQTGRPEIKLNELPDEIALETTNCIICGNDDAALLFEREDLGTDQPGRFRVVCCRRCDHVYLNPRPTLESIGFYYPPSYSPYNQPHPADMRTPWGKFLATQPLNRRAQFIKRYVLGGRILDLGCAEGQFLNQLKKYGPWECAGLEFSAEAVAEAQRRYDFEVTAGTITGGRPWPDGYFDVITMWDVIEHLHHPLADLQVIQRLLKPDGYLILSTPIRHSLGNRLFGRFWVGYELPRHLHIFSEATLSKLLAKAGFELVKRQILLGSNHAFADSVGFWAKGVELNPALQSFIRYAFNNKLWLLTSPLLFKVLDVFGLTTPVTFVFAKAKAKN